ncbi:MAG: hypothetical protein KBC91_03890 [Candidatus Omnitrophica bacterium]|nr:hypothetical protein [Candidatus Omnitrophota bacterium]
MDRPLSSSLLADRKAFQSDLTQCRTYAERVQLFQNHIFEEMDRIRADYSAAGLSSLTEFAGRTAEWLAFLLTEAFWWVFEETTVASCASPEQTNLRKEAGLFWRISPAAASPSLGTSLELFVLFCEAKTRADAQFLTRFYAEFAERLEKIFRPDEVPQGAESYWFDVRVQIEPVFDFKRRNFSIRETGFTKRLTWLKLKPVAGAASVLREVEEARQAYVFSDKPILFKEAALDRIRRQQECSGKPNARFSPGGLLDIEYLAAVLQMAFGRKLPGDIRSPETLTALYGLWQAGALGEKHYQDLRAAYVFLTGLAAILETGRGTLCNADLPDLTSEAFVQVGRQMGYQGPDAHAHSEFRLAFQHHMAGAERLYTDIMINLANQPWDQIPAAVVISPESVRVRLDDLLRGAPRPEDVPALRRMGFSEIHEIGRRFQALCPNMTAFEPFSKVIEKSWALWPEIPSPDLALENLKLFAEKNEDPYRFWYALAKSDKGLRLLLHIFGTSRYLSALFLKMRECWPWVEQTQFLTTAQTLDLLNNPDRPITNFAELNYFKDRETLRLALTDLFMGVPFDSLMAAHGRLVSFVLQRLAAFIPGAERTVLIGLGGTGSGAAPIGAEWNFRIVSSTEEGVVCGRAWLEKITGDVGANIWTHRGAVQDQGDPVFLLTTEALTKQFKQTEVLSLAAPWLQMTVLAGDPVLGQEVLQSLRQAWREPLWLEARPLKSLMAERDQTHILLMARHEETRDVVLAPGGLRDVEWIVAAAWSRRARENFQPCGLLEMLAAVEAGLILPKDECAHLREAMLEYQKIRTRIGFSVSTVSSLLPPDSEDFRIAAKAVGFRDQGIHPAEKLFEQHLTRLRQNVRTVFERFFQTALN